jgi:hypothetical protein
MAADDGARPVTIVDDHGGELKHVVNLSAATCRWALGSVVA